MKKIDALVDAANLDAIQDRLALIGILRLTTFEVNVLPAPETPAPSVLFYRGVAVTRPARRMQVQVLVEDMLADAVVRAIQLLTQNQRRRPDSVVAYPVTAAASGGEQPADQEGAATAAAA